jgi:outer membrane lipoprotein LolB
MSGFAACAQRAEFGRLGLFLVGIMALAGCSTAPPRIIESVVLAAQERRVVQLAAQTQWALSGKIAVSDGNDGGSGRIEWRQDGERFQIEIRAPVSRRTWRLSGVPGEARIEGLDQGSRSGPDAQTLLSEEVGWTVPVADLVAWVRGARGLGASEIEFDSERRPARLHQSGWMVEYRAWDESEPPLPRKLFARRGEQRVRVMVERWDDVSGLR